MNSRRHAPRVASDQAGARAQLLTLGLLFLCLVAGGASRLNAMNVLVLELASLAPLAWAVSRLSTTDGWRSLWQPLALMAAAAAIPLLQLIPLPPDLWARLPGRDAPADILRLAGLESWRPYSLTPGWTLSGAIALLPPFAVFLLTCCLSLREREWLARAVLAAAVLGLVLGIGQVMTDGRFLVYDVPYTGGASGFFANRNHYAALLLCALPLAAVLIAQVNVRSREQALLLTLAGLVIFLVVIIGVAMARSRAGVLLLAPAFLGSFAIVWRRKGGQIGRWPILAFSGVVVVAGLLGALFGLGPLLARFSTSGTEDIRFAALPTIWRGGFDFLPFGSGIGSFDPAFQSLEPINLVGPEFLNHAHNEYAEIWLETGLLGVVALVAFFAWWGYAFWKSIAGGSAQRSPLALAGATMSGLLLLHSIVDYPLRTLALATLFAFACGLLVPPVNKSSGTLPNAELIGDRTARKSRRR